LNQLNVRVGAYRYGFNGKENDNEVKGVGDQQDYGMRIYDPRVGRFLSVDPLEKKYPELTPYQYASNRPIDGIDQDGLEYFSIANVHSSAVQKAQMMQLRSDQTALRIKQSQPTFTEYHTPSNTIEQQKHDDLQTEVMDNAGLNSDGSQKLLTRLSANKGFQNLANRMVLPAVKAYSYVAGIGEEEAAIETFYRAMSEADFAIFQKTGAIPATGETFISPTAAYSSKYTGVLVEINTKQGTYDELMKMGVRNVAEKHPYPELPLVENTKGWTQDNAFFKYETPKGGTGQVNIGLGKGKALETFNKNIVSYKVLGQK
jgi:RHS repeat-associated protein